MKIRFIVIGLLFIFNSVAFGAKISNELAKEAYIYAYSMDEAYKFLYRTAIEPDYPFNRFHNLREIADDTYTDHPTINNETLHLMGWLDIEAEPVIVSVPDMDEGRYWLLHTMDMGHYTDSMIGSRTRGNKGGRFMFATKKWKGEVPDSVDAVIRSDSYFVKLMGRILATGPEDTKKALFYMDQWNIRTLSEYLGMNGPKPVKRNYPDPAKTSWLERVNFVLCYSTLAEADQKWLEKFKPIGLEPCKYDFTPEQLKAAKIGEKLGIAHIKEVSKTITDSRLVVGTRESLGDAPRDEFSVGTYVGQWGLPPEEAAYRKIEQDNNGEMLDGSKHEYIMKFKAPNVSEFWSITVYRSDNLLMAKNSLNRHSRGDRNLKPDADGYYTIILSSDEEKYKDNTNYLPVPSQQFYLMMRMYGADEAIQKGDYDMPIPKKITSKK